MAKPPLQKNVIDLNKLKVMIKRVNTGTKPEQFTTKMEKIGLDLKRDINRKK
jgi:hypothetical protein